MNVINFEEKSCDRTRRYLDAYVSNELTVETSLEVLRHLEHCRDCAEALEARRTVKEALKRAVERQDPAPAELPERIRKSLKPATTWRHWSLAVAASLLLVLGGWAILRGRSLRSSASLPAQASLNQGLSEQTTKILHLGLRDHVTCLPHQNFSAGPRSFERMSHDLGPDYIGLVALVKDRVPPDYTVMVAHHCRVEGRDFVHLILAEQQNLLSVIFTKKNGESYDQAGAGAVERVSGVPLYRAHSQNFEVVGFETRDYLAYVISGLTRESNLQIASRLAPSMRDFLAKLEG